VVKVVIPLARGEDAHKQLSGYTPLIEIAGKSLLGHLLDQVAPLKPEEIIFVVHGHERSLIKYVKANCSFPYRFIKQKMVKGSAHAIYGAKPFIKDDVLILFGDTLLDQLSLSSLPKTASGGIWVSEVSDPRTFGVVFLNAGFASRLIEKPDEPVSTLVMVGAYYIKNSSALFEACKFLLSNNIMSNGAFHLTDALQIMIDKGSRLAPITAKNWIDVDREGGLIQANKLLCKRSKGVRGRVKNSVIVHPVIIDKGAVVVDSVIGPYVSVAGGARISNSVVNNSILAKEAVVKDAVITDSIIGHRASLKGRFSKVNVADRSLARIE
jgi:glucose-1-phosphate thymidylyltransferase